jgi:hypothetical protein
MKLRSFTHPANPSFDEGESLWAMFKGFRARVTLTDKRIIVSRFGHTSILYGDATDRLSNGRTRMTFRQFARCYERCIADETHNHARKAGHVRTVSESGHPLGYRQSGEPRRHSLNKGVGPSESTGVRRAERVRSPVRP